MRTPLDLLLTERALNLVRISTGRDLLDHLEDNAIQANIELKNICAKVSPELAKEIEAICGLLDIRKRSFIEAALIEAVSRAHAIIDAEGVHEAIGASEAEEIEIETKEGSHTLRRAK